MNNGSGISANPELIKSYGTVIAGLGTEYKREITSIYNTIDRLSSSWQGENARKFETTVKGYEEDLKKLGTVIEDIGTDLGTISGIYATVQEELTDEAGNL